MKNQIKHLPIALVWLALSTLNSQLSTAHAQGTAFTYQGQLQNNGSPAAGTYNLTFSLFNDTNSFVPPVAGPVTNNGVIVTNGLFTVTIDFGSDVWNGQPNWLQIGVETNGADNFTPLTPPQQLTPVPYAIFAESSSNLLGALPASQLTTVSGGYGNFFVGLSGNSTTTGAYNTANGDAALIANTSGSYNTAYGALVLQNNATGSYNTANGAYALLANQTGSHNTADGVEALYNNGSGNNNTAVGVSALQNLGEFAPGGTNNIALGYQAGYNYTRNESSNIDIGNLGVAGEANIIRIGSGQSQTFIAGVINGNGGGLTNLNINAAQFSGTVSNAVTFSNANNSFFGSFAGNGGGLTNLNVAALNGLNATNFWQTTGNSGTTAGVNFVGTTDNQPLELHVNGLRALRLEPTANDGSHASIVNVVQGSAVNYAGAGVYGATISGGGALNYFGSFSTNSVTADFGTVSGGAANTASGSGGTIGGGEANTASSSGGTIGGGAANTASGSLAFIGGGAINTNSGPGGTIGGGQLNSISVGSLVATVAGGYGNTAGGSGAFIGGGGYDGSTTGGNTAIGNASVIGGGLGNTIQTNATYSTIGGGTANSIQISAYTSTISGGANNTIQTNATDSTIGGGTVNSIQTNAFQSTIAGGNLNVIQPNAAQSAIGGGDQNVIQANAPDSVIAGGQQNTIQTLADHSFIGGGAGNVIVGSSTLFVYGTIGGGSNNSIQTNSANATISGGLGNTILAGGSYAFIGGGQFNTNAANDSSIGGGVNNTIQTNTYNSVLGGGFYNSIFTNQNISTIAGGLYNQIGGGNRGPTVILVADQGNTVAGGGGNFIAEGASGSVITGGVNNKASGIAATVGGGSYNMATTNYATVPGGSNNIAGGQYSFAAGDNAQATNNGAFVWSDGSASTASTANYQFVARASGGFYFYSNTGGSATMQLDSSGNLAIAGTLSQSSDRNVKKNFTPVNPQAVLARVAALPISEWVYKADAGAQHIGPMAQDFHAAFGLNGPDDKHIATVDEEGVALAAIQGLNQKLQDELNRQDAENAKLKQQNDLLAERLNELEVTVKQLAANK